jgi:hypothetical protein
MVSETGCFLNKSSCLAAALGVTEFVTITNMILVTLICCLSLTYTVN